ncbi:MAG: hypothetical protein MK212_02500, partial [Saprospiraceae bacterium]|nr:hypothetical protein [Saprospiraceae bacterium]
SPLEYIRSEPTLVWAWYVLLGTGLLYVLFRAKRKQRIIPVVAPNRNTSLEFVNTISSLYFQQQNHKTIFRKQMQLFLSHLRNRYNLVTRDLDDQLIRKIIIRSEVDEETVRAIFDEYKRVEKHLDDPYVEVASKTLVNFYLMIEKFHKEVAENEGKYN